MYSAQHMILSFILTSLIIELTPGPNMTYLALLSAKEGRKAGFSAIIGVALGLLIVGSAAAFGVTALIMDIPVAYEILRWGGVLYMLWLAWDGWQPDRETSPGKAKESPEDIKFFTQGLITNLLNPKAAIFYIAMLPNFINKTHDILTQTITLTIIYVLIATLIHSIIIFSASFAHEWLKHPKRNLLARRLFSLILVAVALWFAWATAL